MDGGLGRICWLPVGWPKSDTAELPLNIKDDFLRMTSVLQWGEKRSQQWLGIGSVSNFVPVPAGQSSQGLHTCLWRAVTCYRLDWRLEQVLLVHTPYA